MSAAGAGSKGQDGTRRGSVVLSWGGWGGFYVRVARWAHLPFGWSGRVCLGWVALTWFPVEIDDVMEAYADAPAAASSSSLKGDDDA